MIKIATADLLRLQMFAKLGANENQMFARLHEMAEEIAFRQGVTKEAALRSLTDVLTKSAAGQQRTRDQKQRMANAQAKLDPKNRGTVAQEKGIAKRIKQQEGNPSVGAASSVGA